MSAPRLPSREYFAPEDTSYCFFCEEERPVVAMPHRTGASVLALTALSLGVNLIISWTTRLLLGRRCARCNLRILENSKQLSPQDLAAQVIRGFWRRYAALVCFVALCWFVLLQYFHVAPIPFMLAALPGSVATLLVAGIGVYANFRARSLRTESAASKEKLLELLRDVEFEWRFMF